MKRKDNWIGRLYERLEEKESESFEWGTNDCALFASDLMKSMTGTDPAEWFRDRYDSERGAYFALHRSPFSGEDPPEGFNELFSKVVSTLAEEHGMNPVEPEKLQRGDLALVKQYEGLYAMGIWVGGGAAVPSRGENGYYLKDRPDHEYCWRVPY